jgi:uncharacterized protein (TIGR02145 family)
MLKKIRNITRKTLTYSSFLPLLFQCHKEIIPPSDFEGENKFKVTKNTKILKNHHLENIDKISPNSIKFFDVHRYKKGDVLIAGVDEKTPKGLLRKVESIDYNTNTLYTEDASLEDVIVDGEIRFSKELTQSDVSLPSLKSSNSNYNFCNKIDEIIYDADGDFTTDYDQIKAVGTFEFNASIEADAIFEDGFKSGYFSTKIDGVLDLDFKINTNFEFKNNKKIIDLEFAPIAIPSPIPIVMTPGIEAYIGAVGRLNGELSLNVYSDTYLMGKISYNKESGWKSENNRELHFDIEPDMKLGGEAKVFLSPKITLTTNGIFCMFSEVEKYFRVDADLSYDPWLIAYNGLNFNIGANAGFFASFVPEYKKTLFTLENILFQAENPETNTNRFVDYRDGQEYNTIQIGDQIWFLENLNYNTPSSIYYDNNANNNIGKLYSWGDIENACPDGWRIPSREDWCKLINYFDIDNHCKVDEISGFQYAFYELKKCGFVDQAGGFYSNEAGFIGKDEANGLWLYPEISNDSGDKVRPIRIMHNKFEHIINGFINDKDETYKFYIRPMKDVN